MIIYNQYGEPRDTRDIEAATRLIKLRNTKDIWTVIDECINIWRSKRPSEYKSFIVDLDMTKKTRSNKFASSKTEMYRYTVDVPEMVIFMLRKLYTTDELQMDKNFFRKWAKKYPTMQVAEKI